jgi:conjugal transfer mating pair stabilization protein TraG
MSHGHKAHHPHHAKKEEKKKDPDFSMLPVAGAGYYTYSPSNRQYATFTTIEVILDVGLEQSLNRPHALIGVGDMSFEHGGLMDPHHSHQHGRSIDIRPMRKDHHRAPTNIYLPSYDREATRLLVESLLAHKNVQRILFNDTQIKGVHTFAGHDNHLHVETKK